MRTFYLYSVMAGRSCIGDQVMSVNLLEVRIPSCYYGNAAYVVENNIGLILVYHQYFSPYYIWQQLNFTIFPILSRFIPKFS